VLRSGGATQQVIYRKVWLKLDICLSNDSVSELGRALR
jgi:hypothetical protein